MTVTAAMPMRAFPLADHLSTALILVTPALKIAYLNPSAEALLEISLSRAVGMPLLKVFCEQNPQLDPQTAFLNTLRTGHLYTRREAVIKVGLRDKRVDYSASLIFDAPSDAIDRHLLIEVQTIDRLMRISRDEQLSQQHHVARQLVRGVAHEIKNPLGGIRGASQLLARSLPDDRDQQELVGIIISEVDRLKSLVDNMLGSHRQPQLRAVNIHEPLERVLSLLKSQAGDSVQFVRDYDLSLPEIQADANQLIQVFLNIGVNALQAMTEHPEQMQGRHPSLRLRTCVQRSFTIHGQLYRSVIRIDVQDNGPGIPAELLESVFYPMVTGRAEGTGLGLSIAQNIVHQHGGLLECESEAGCTVFSIFLPWS